MKSIEYPYTEKTSKRKKSKRYHFYKKLLNFFNSNFIEIPPNVRVFPIFVISLLIILNITNVVNFSQLSNYELLVWILIIIYFISSISNLLKDLLDYRYGLIKGNLIIIIIKKFLKQTILFFINIFVIIFLISFLNLFIELSLSLLVPLLFLVGFFNIKNNDESPKTLQKIKEKLLFNLVRIRTGSKFKKIHLDILSKKINKIAIANNIGKVKDVYELQISHKSRKITAFIINSMKSVFITDTLIQNFHENEIKVIILHELGHIKYNEESKKIQNRTFYILISGILLLSLIGHVFLVQSPLNMLYKIGGFYIIMTISFGYYNIYHSKIERKADRFALKNCEKPIDYISAFKKMADFNLVKLKKHNRFEKFSSSHPSLKKRIMMGKEKIN